MAVSESTAPRLIRYVPRLGHVRTVDSRLPLPPVQSDGSQWTSFRLALPRMASWPTQMGG